MLSLIFASLFVQIVFSQVYYEPENSAPAAQLSSSSSSNTAVSRYTVMYLCGNNGNYYLSNTPCQTTYRSCNYICRTSNWCASFNRNWSCVNSCCKSGRGGHTTTPSPQQPTCGGRETSGGFCTSPGYRCPSGFTCTVNGVCCRCAYGTSVGPCVNNQCPDTFRCNSNNECCPYQLTGK